MWLHFFPIRAHTHINSHACLENISIAHENWNTCALLWASNGPLKYIMLEICIAVSNTYILSVEFHIEAENKKVNKLNDLSSLGIE